MAKPLAKNELEDLFEESSRGLFKLPPRRLLWKIEEYHRKFFSNYSRYPGEELKQILRIKIKMGVFCT